MRILVDIDSTIADMMPVWLEMYNNDYGDRLEPEDITGWSIHTFVKHECGKKIYSYLSRDGF